MTTADPYRWLETNPADWILREDDAAASYLAALPEHSWFSKTMAAILASPRTGIPQYRAGWYLVLRNNGQQQHDVLSAARSLPELLLDGRAVVDPNTMDGSLSLDKLQCQRRRPLPDLRDADRRQSATDLPHHRTGQRTRTGRYRCQRQVLRCHLAAGQYVVPVSAGHRRDRRPAATTSARYSAGR